jgi:hypothetical protein
MIQRVADLQWLGFYAGLTTWALLAICLLVVLSGQKWKIAKRLVKFIINSFVFLVAYSFMAQFGIVVKWGVPDRDEAEQIKELDKWIKGVAETQLVFGLTVVGLLIGFNYMWYRTADRHRYKTDIIVLLCADLLIVLAGIGLGVMDAHYGLAAEIKRATYHR